MDKTSADKYIYEYRDRIFGFALGKTRNIDQAEELASDIVYEVYRAFLAKDNIANTDGYVYRIARNVWSKYVQRLEQGRNNENVDNITIPVYDEHDKDELNTVAELRKEIGYLSDRQRLVIYMHYYDGLSVAEISSRLNISQGTVKWHLSDARTKLKAGITMNIEKDLEINPIRFGDMGHGGYTGNKGDTADFFQSRLRMNIAWACYHEPKTLEEIARSVGVPKVYIADEMAALEDFGFIDRVDSSKDPKFLTNMVIYDLRQNEDDRTLEERINSAVDTLCRIYFPKVLSDFEEAPDHWGMTCDGNDVNFMKYSAVMLAIKALRFTGEAKINEMAEKLMVKRPDGGNFIAYATLTDDRFSSHQIKDKYWACGEMTRVDVGDDPKKNLFSFSVDCMYADRKGGWRDNLDSDWVSLTRFIHDGRDSLTPEEYKRLMDKGYIFEGRVQPVVVKCDTSEMLREYIDHYVKDKIYIPDEIKDISKAIDKAVFEHDIKNQPKQVHDIIRFNATDRLGTMKMLPRVIEKLLDLGLLKPLTDIQKKSVFSILCLQET